MDLREACELLVRAWRAANAVDFWRAVALVAAVLERAEVQDVDVDEIGAFGA